MTKLTDHLNRFSHSDEAQEVYTPPNAMAALVPFLDKDLCYYDPTSNTSTNIVDGLLTLGYNCTRSNGGDFFDLPYVEEGCALVLNPPYNNKDNFLRKCYELGKPFAMLLPVAALQGQTRGKMFMEYGVSVLVYNKRLDFTGGGAPNFGNAWFMGNNFGGPSGQLHFTDYGV